MKVKGTDLKDILITEVICIIMLLRDDWMDKGFDKEKS